MNREILFRGKRVDNGEWTEGYFFKSWDKVFLLWGMTGDCPNMEEVIPETVGQFTGLCDKNGKKIFEWDIMQLCSACYPCLVYWDGRSWAWKQNGKRREIDLTREKMEIIGNIYDNKEEEE